MNVFAMIAASALLTLLPGQPVHAAPQHAAGAQESESARQIAEVLSLEQLRTRAIAQKDVTVLKSLIGPTYCHIDSSGRLRTKTDFILSIERGEFNSAKYTIDSAEVEINGTVALVRGIFTVEKGDGNTVERYSGRYVRVWTNTAGRWMNTMQQATRIRASGDGRPLVMQ
jgi:hypothetical protein